MQNKTDDLRECLDELDAWIGELEDAGKAA